MRGSIFELQITPGGYPFLSRTVGSRFPCSSRLWKFGFTQKPNQSQIYAIWLLYIKPALNQNKTYKPSLNSKGMDPIKISIWIWTTKWSPTATWPLLWQQRRHPQEVTWSLRSIGVSWWHNPSSNQLGHIEPQQNERTHCPSSGHSCLGLFVSWFRLLWSRIPHNFIWEHFIEGMDQVINLVSPWS